MAEPDHGGVPSLAMADIMIGLSAILLVIVAALSTQAAQLASAALQSSADAEARIARAAQSHAAQSGDPVLIAQADGLLFVAPTGDTAIPLDAIATWTPPPLPAAPLLIVGPRGLEADFLLGPALARAGVEQAQRLRIAGACARLLRGATGSLRCE
ncbi:hypothetical protein [Marivita sp. GX14005]|uniref:hypothetical protein n=1 Tax=Marivita sp. GX14005 TaxID=2942276 RepID=UPI0020193181|nr:hypothetical protein [Marivita sp. GX14005]MCL3883298.1 hypothetical protein [Marivita sp. GX14005]